MVLGFTSSTIAPDNLLLRFILLTGERARKRSLIFNGFCPSYSSLEVAHLETLLYGLDLSVIRFPGNGTLQSGFEPNL